MSKARERVKVFTSEEKGTGEEVQFEDLERRVDLWLEQNPGVQITDRRVTSCSVTTNVHEDDRICLLSIVLFYREGEDDALVSEDDLALLKPGGLKARMAAAREAAENRVERRYLLALLSITKGDLQAAALRGQMSLKYLEQRLAKHGIEPKRADG